MNLRKFWKRIEKFFEPKCPECGAKLEIELHGGSPSSVWDEKCSCGYETFIDNSRP